MPYNSEKGLDEKQEAILEYIKEYRETQGHAPSVSDIVLETGIGPSVVNDRLEKLERAGVIEQNRFGIKLITPVQQNTPSITDRKLRVFLCHASQDKPIVRELYQRLLAEGWIDPWLDEEKLLPGQDWDMEIEKAVEAADAVMVCLSNNSVTREGYVQKELRFALSLALEKPEDVIFIIPLRFDDCSLPRILRSIQYIDYFPIERREWVARRLLESLMKRANAVGVVASVQLPAKESDSSDDTKAKLSKSKASKRNYIEHKPRKDMVSPVSPVEAKHEEWVMPLRSFWDVFFITAVIPPLPLSLLWSWFVSVGTGSDFRFVFANSIWNGVLFGLGFGWWMASLFKGTTISFPVRNTTTFSSKLNDVLTRMGYALGSENQNRWIYKPMYKAGILAGKIYIQLEKDLAILGGPEYHLKRIKKQLLVENQQIF